MSGDNTEELYSRVKRGSSEWDTGDSTVARVAVCCSCNRSLTRSHGLVQEGSLQIVCTNCYLLGYIKNLLQDTSRSVTPDSLSQVTEFLEAAALTLHRLADRSVRSEDASEGESERRRRLTPG